MNASDEKARKPLLFICSSEERIDIAEDIKTGLADAADVVLWKDDDVFPPSDTFLESLLSQADKVDFAVIILSPDDMVTSRLQNQTIPRDNLVFEAGLFIGKLGRHRTFLVAANSLDFKLPSDLQGINITKYNISAANPYSLVLPILRRAISKHGQINRSHFEDPIPRLNVSNARNEILSAVQAMPGLSTVEIDWLGLDFSIACDYVCDLLDADDTHHLSIRILLMAGDVTAARRRDHPVEVTQWRTYVKGSISRMQSKAHSLIGARTQKGLKTTLIAKSYFDIPTVHGVFIRTPIQRAFVSLCYFEPKPPHDFTWGEFGYYSFQPPAPKSSGANLLMEAFVGFFCHRWPDAKEHFAIEQ